jgi:hypothetical protein
MKQIIDWLMRDEQKELYEFVFASALNILFLGLLALSLWPLGKLPLAVRLSKGYSVLWGVLFITGFLLLRLQRRFRVNLYDHGDAYVISGLVVSGFLQVGWSAFLALTLRAFVADAHVWLAVVLYFVGVLSCYVAFVVVSSFYQGHIYKFVNLALALASFAAFSVWPGSARALYGWFFKLFEWTR